MDGFYREPSTMIMVSTAESQHHNQARGVALPLLSKLIDKPVDFQAQYTLKGSKGSYAPLR